ncbi:ribosomal protein S5 domain 2-like protein [Exidia glandulosa HHB12029]|uniref:Ribosomal protein S5 domain 2-like protein n=1 Tax=Exidia glandulosa HHB12029 TaxID=1314781 RepID=A0A165GUX1_EXIGL|nr:ribosomal protein S5 domain 2-like protein [Exidia glandulosa HHB12029]
MQSSIDRRRITGPEESFAPVFAQDEQSNEQQPKARVGRTPRDIRPIFLQTGLITQANGSAYIETERTKIACAVYGPRQLKNTPYSDKGKLNVEVKFAPFSCRTRRVPNRDAEDRSIANLVHQALLPAVRLELLPKSSLDVFVTVLEADGLAGCVAAASIAASAALAHAGVEMFGLVTSCAATVVENEVWMDPDETEQERGRGTLVLACMPALGTVTSAWQAGQMSAAESLQCMKECQERCTDVHFVVAKALTDSRPAT